MTLNELAKKLRRVFKFKYLTYDVFNKVRLWNVKPEYRLPYYHNGPLDHGTWRIPRGINTREEAALAEVYGFGRSLIEPIDFSEYKDGRFIDYSKCVVEVEE